MKSQKWFLMISLLILASMVLGACAPAATPTAAPTTAPVMTEAPVATEAPAMTEAPTEAPAASTPADTIVIGTTDTVASFDPADAYSTRDWEIIKNINEGLVKWKPGSGDELVPAMATSMPDISADGSDLYLHAEGRH